MSVSDNVSWSEHPHAPIPGHQLCEAEAIDDGGVKEFVFGEGKDAFRMLVLRSGEAVWGYVNACPHFWVPLNTGEGGFLVFEHAQIFCATHYAVFRYEDGYCEDGPCQGAYLERVPLRNAEGQVRIAEG